MPTPNGRTCGTASKTYLETLTIGASGSAGSPILICGSSDPGHDGTVIIDGQRYVLHLVPSGILHEEFHSEAFTRRGGVLEMVQLWVNLPAKDKMAAPGYQGLTADQIPAVALPQEAGTARIIAGRYGDTQGAARTFTPMNVWDLRLQAGRTLAVDLPAGHTTALFVLRGSLQIGAHTIRAAELAVLRREGTQLVCDITEDAMVLLLNGEPLNEPIVGHGPFVMNTRQEISQAIHDFNSGKFGRIVQ